MSNKIKKLSDVFQYETEDLIDNLHELSYNELNQLVKSNIDKLNANFLYKSIPALHYDKNPDYNDLFSLIVFYYRRNYESKSNNIINDILNLPKDEKDNIEIETYPEIKNNNIRLVLIWIDKNKNRSISISDLYNEIFIISNRYNIYFSHEDHRSFSDHYLMKRKTNLYDKYYRFEKEKDINNQKVLTLTKIYNKK